MNEPLPLVRLAELAELRMGGTPSRADPSFWAEGRSGHAWAAISDLSGKYLEATAETITSAGARSARLRAIPAGIPIMSFKLSLGKTSIPQIPVYTNEAIVALQPRPGCSDAKWLYHAVPYVARRAVTETAVKGQTLNLEKLNDLQIPAPNIAEQRRIAEILDSADDAVEVTEAYVGKLKTSQQAILGEVLSRGLDEDGSLRSDEGTARFEETSLGRIPPDWRILPLGELAEYVNGYAFKPEDWGDAGLPIIRIQNINGSREFNFFEGPVDPSIVIDAGDLLFAWSGTRHTSFGPAIWPGPRAILNQHIFKVRERRMTVERRFLYLLLENSLERIAASAHGFKDSFVHVKREDLTSVLVAVPPLSEQRRIVEAAESGESLIGFFDSKLNCLRQVRTALSDELLGGLVRATSVSL